jgi:hypothetical protein
MAEKLTAKEAQARAKAAAKAEKLRRKNSTDPRDMGRIRQIIATYKMTAEYDKSLHLITALSFVVPVLIAVLLAVLLNAGIFSWIMFILTGLMTGLLLAMWLLISRTKKATFKRYAGEVGSAEVALQMLGKKWVHDPVVAATKHKDVVHRAVGPGGIVLVSEGDPNRARQLLVNEQRKHEKVVNNVVVTTIQMGDKQGQVPLNQLTKTVAKLPKVLQAHQITDVRNRLRAIDAVRPKVPLPRGPMPNMRGAKKGMRGR